MFRLPLNLAPTQAPDWRWTRREPRNRPTGGRLVFGIFGALAEFERELIRERTIAGLASARARGRNGGRPYTMTSAKVRLAQAAMAKRDTKVGDLCKELGVTRQTLYRFVGPKGELREDGRKLLDSKGKKGQEEETRAALVAGSII